MKNFFLRFFKGYDWFLLGSAIFLCALGLTILFSTTYDLNIESEATKQVFNVGIGLIALFALSKIDYRFYKSYTGVMYILVILLLLSVRFFGKTALGATRWIDFGFFQFQPSLVAQLLMAVILAKFFSDNYEEMRTFKLILRSAIYVAIPTVLVALQPDLGTALVFVFMWGTMILASNAKKIYLAVFGVAGLASLPLVWNFLKEYQKNRILTFMNPTIDPQGAGWNVNQAMIAIGSGQFWGRGLGHGTQSQLNFIPEKHTDFVFASLAEEMGFLGVMMLLGLYLIMFFRGIRVAVLARDFFGTYLTIGILAMLFVHVFVNVGMNMGIMPVTGIPLPLISYGGTPILVDLAAIGILENIYARYKKIDF
jgi:rod shape determining protein RodA